MEPEKVHPTDEFVIVAKFGDHVLCHLASRLANVIRQGERQTKNLVLKIRTQASVIIALFYALYLGLVMSKQFNKGTFRHIICL